MVLRFFQYQALRKPVRLRESIYAKDLTDSFHGNAIFEEQKANGTSHVVPGYSIDPSFLDDAKPKTLNNSLRLIPHLASPNIAG